MSDVIPHNIEGLNRQGGPMQAAFKITPDDNADLSTFTRVLYVGTSGPLKARMVNGDIIERTFEQGYHPLAIDKVFATGTTAAEIWGHY